MDESASVTRSTVGSTPARKEFELLIYKQLNSQASQIREAFKDMVNLIVDAQSAREALTALKDPIKKDSALIQLKGLSILGACVKNCNHDFHAELATKKWMDRLLKIVRTTRDERVKDKILQLLVDWASMFQLQPHLQEFSIALHRLKAKGLELPAPSEKGKETRRGRRPGTGAGGGGAGTVTAGTRTRTGANPGQQEQQLTAIEIALHNFLADASNLELGLERPDMLQAGIAEECRKHLSKISVVLSTDLPDQFTYEFINLADRLHELLGLYDALFTDSTPAAKREEKEANEMKKLEQEILRENEQTEAKRVELQTLKANLVDAEAELVESQRIAAEKARAQKGIQNEKEQRLHECLTKAVTKVANVRDSVNELRESMRSELDKVKDGNHKFIPELEKSLNAYPEEVERAKMGETRAMQMLKKLYTIEVNTRKTLYNKLQELRGNIRVYCRVRPLSKKEIGEGVDICTTFPSQGEIVIREGGKQKVYEFDIVFQPEGTQEEVFEDSKPLVNCVVDGYKVCIFAYGQTGSGKTHTMQGPPSDPGINRRALNRLFELIAERAEMERAEVRVSVLEIHNETIRDLLADKVEDGKKKTYEIKTHPTDGQYVEGLVSHEVRCTTDIDQHMAKAERNRSVGRTNMNEHSSRSHMLLYIIVRSTNIQSQTTTVGKLSLVDLAGSERVGKSGATGERMKEAQAINKSLSALGDVMSALGSNQSHIPFRNSKLTHLLKDSLGGNSKCLMFVNCSPAASNANETNNSLGFAFRARGVVLGPAKKNVSK